MDYSMHTVKELKEMVKGRTMAIVNGTKKADYIKALQDDDAYEKSQQNFYKQMDEWKEDMANDTKRITEGMAKIRDAVKKLDGKITSLKSKEGKAIDDYKELVALLDSRMKLMRDW